MNGVFSLQVTSEESVVSDRRIKQLAYGAVTLARSFSGIIVNGYRFHTKAYSEGRSTTNCGVCVRGSSIGENEIDYYGVIEEVLELDYLGVNRVALLRCHWFDPVHGVKVDPVLGIVTVNQKSKLRSNEPFVLASQAQQVYYAPYPENRGRPNDWHVAIKVREKLFLMETYRDNDSDDIAENVSELPAEHFYQEDETHPIINTIASIEDNIALVDTRSPMEEISVDEIQGEINNNDLGDDGFIVDDEIDDDNNRSDEESEESDFYDSD